MYYVLSSIILSCPLNPPEGDLFNSLSAIKSSDYHIIPYLDPVTLPNKLFLYLPDLFNPPRSPIFTHRSCE